MTRLDGGRTLESHVAIEENEAEDTRVGSVSNGEQTGFDNSPETP